MASTLVRTLASHLPQAWQDEAKRLHYRLQILRGRFRSIEPEYNLLESFVKEGDWVIDIGANVGHYTLKLSRLVGTSGRVIALEPIPRTFSLLATNVSCAGLGNVTLLNVAASDSVRTVGMQVPRQRGARNFYQARVTSDPGSEHSTLTIPVDALCCARRVSLVKVDTEGHEINVLGGMTALLNRDRPTLVVESGNDKVDVMLQDYGYHGERLPGSPNRVFRCNDGSAR